MSQHLASITKILVTPDAFDPLQKLFNGASATGNKVIAVKTSDVEKGVLSVKPDLFGDTVFVTVK